MNKNVNTTKWHKQFLGETVYHNMQSDRYKGKKENKAKAIFRHFHIWSNDNV